MQQYIPGIISRLSKHLKRVGVLISGSGTNLQALIDATQDPSQHVGAEIVLVISNKPNVEGLKRAERVGIKTVVINILLNLPSLIFSYEISIYHLCLMYNRLLNILIILQGKLLMKQ